jgi:uncharacterized protein (TIGR03435 family)
MMRCVSVWMLLGVMLVVGLTAQAPPSTGPRFEVATVKPSRPNAVGGGFDAPPGRFSAENQPLADLIFFAYDTDRFRTVGPDWIARERFDISATGAVTGQYQSMLRQLLQDRFGLRAHFDSRRVSVYVLTVARADGTLGPNLRKVEMDCAKREPLPDGMMPCGTRNQPRGTLVARGTNWQKAILHREIATTMDRLVLDRTSLTGQFDMRLEWLDPVAQSTDAPAVDRPSLVTALREQLGLKLEPAIEAVPVLVIDRIERPSPD